MPKQTKQQQIDELERSLATEQASLRELIKENEFLTKQFDAKDQRIKDIAAENESLRMDKKWLQQTIQRLIEMKPQQRSMLDTIRDERPR